MLNIVVFASGNGSNFQAIVDAVNNKELDLKIKYLVCDKEDAYVIERAKENSIDTIIINYKENSKDDIERMLVKVLKEAKIDIIILAGFLRVFSPLFISNFRNKIINIHPSLLPKYKGLHAVEQAIANNDTVIGATVHYVNEELDSGAIILQEEIEINNLDTKAIYAKLHKVEHRLYIAAIKKVMEV